MLLWILATSECDMEALIIYCLSRKLHAKYVVTSLKLFLAYYISVVILHLYNLMFYCLLASVLHWY